MFLEILVLAAFIFGWYSYHISKTEYKYRLALAERIHPNVYSISAYLSAITIPPGTIHPKRALLLKILAELVQGLSNTYF